RPTTDLSLARSRLRTLSGRLAIHHKHCYRRGPSPVLRVLLEIPYFCTQGSTNGEPGRTPSGSLPMKIISSFATFSAAMAVGCVKSPQKFGLNLSPYRTSN